MSRHHNCNWQEAVPFQNGEVQGVIQGGGFPWRRECFVTYTYRVPCGLLGIEDEEDDDDDDDDNGRRRRCCRCCCCNYRNTRF